MTKRRKVAFWCELGEMVAKCESEDVLGLMKDTKARGEDEKISNMFSDFVVSGKTKI